MIQFVNGQSLFSEKELDGIYRGLRQGAYWEEKAKEQEKALKLFDSLTSGWQKRSEVWTKKEENYLQIIDNKDKNYEALKDVGVLKVKRVKKKNRKWIWIAGIGGLATGLIIAN